MLRAAVAIAAIGLVAACAAEPPTPTVLNDVAPDVALPSPDIAKQAPAGKREARQIVVHAGQSLSRIAAEYGMPQRTIIAANDLTPPYKIKIGQQLRIPSADEPPAPSVVGSASPEIIPVGGSAGAFLSAASPGVISLFFRNDHYANQEAYLFAIAEAMRPEYEAIAASGIIVQIDCPDLAMGRHIQYADLSVEEFRKRAGLHVAALNHALAAIPPERARMHLCWGNYEGPHHCDVPLAEVIDIAFTARPATISFEAANPRHGHEWAVFERVKLPEGKIVIPGVIESKSNFIEHPELIAQRIARYANLVGRDNVIAGSDCGFGTWVGQAAVDPDVVWAKLSAMAEGARLATKQFWGG